LKLQFGKTAAELTEERMKQNAELLSDHLEHSFPKAPSIQVSPQEEWISVLINEEEADLMTVLNSIQNYRKVYDVAMEEISTESVIRKIYEGGIA
jgi:ABC-2 type transport system ATP-binding protein